MSSRKRRFSASGNGNPSTNSATAGVEPDVRRFAVEEQRCCTFWVFAVDAGSSGVTLRWEGPSTAADLLDHLHRSLLGDAPIGDLTGLL